MGQFAFSVMDNMQRLSPRHSSSVQLLSSVRLFATPWTAARQASLSITNSQSLLKLISIEVVMPSNHLILCRPLLLLSFLASGSFQMSQLFTSDGQSIGVSTSTLVLPMNFQDWFPLGWTGCISLQSEGLSRVFEHLLWRYGSAVDCHRDRGSGCSRLSCGISPFVGGGH